MRLRPGRDVLRAERSRVSLARRAVAEGLGTALLLGAIAGSGVMGAGHGRGLHRIRVLVHEFHIVRQPCGDAGPVVDQHVLRYSAQRRSIVSWGSDPGPWSGPRDAGVAHAEWRGLSCLSVFGSSF